MNIGSVEGLVVGLLLVVPGGLGIALRRSVYAAHAPSPFTELLQSLAAALTAIFCAETLFVIFDGSQEGIGDYLLRPLTDQSGFPVEIDWPAYLAFVIAALALPTTGAWIRRTTLARRLFGSLSPHADGLDYVIHEARPREYRNEEIWVTVNTTGDEALLGQLAWRSTAPDPLEVVLTRVRDLNDPSEEGQEPGWFAWIPEESIRAIWINVPEPESIDS